MDHGWVFLAPRPIRKIFKTLFAATLLANLVLLAGNLSWLGKHDFPAWPQRQFSHAWEPRSCHPVLIWGFLTFKFSFVAFFSHFVLLGDFDFQVFCTKTKKGWHQVLARILSAASQGQGQSARITTSFLGKAVLELFCQGLGGKWA